MTVVYLAYASGGRETLERHAQDGPVNLLVALPSLEHFENHRRNYNIGQWCFDSGAFSVHNSGKEITYKQWFDAAQSVDADEIFGLDVISDAKATQKNLERAWADEIAAIPTYHNGTPWEHLQWCRDQSDKIALGGAAKMSDSQRSKWILNCFSLIWPKKVHGFACSSWKAIKSVPFHSVDASSWIYAPSAMGMWAGYTGRQMALRARNTKDFWIEVVEHQKRERWARQRWRKELGKLEGAAV